MLSSEPRSDSTVALPGTSNVQVIYFIEIISEVVLIRPIIVRVSRDMHVYKVHCTICIFPPVSMFFCTLKITKIIVHVVHNIQYKLMVSLDDTLKVSIDK